MQIHDISLENPVISAPLAGISDRAFREIARVHGCGLLCSEMLSSMALVYQNRKTLNMMSFSELEKPISIQIAGWRSDIMAEAAKIIESFGADIIDINAGCSVRKVLQNYEGAHLLRDFPRAREIIKSVVKAVNIPVTLKMRKIWSGSYDETLNFAKMAEEEGIKAITIHGRTPLQQFSGKADWEIIKFLKSNLSVPVIGNGDIKTPADAISLMKMSGCDGIMIGRASMGNPWIFSRIIAGIKGQKVPFGPDITERIDTALKHFRLLIEYKGEFIGVRQMRKHLAWYIKGLKGATRLREKIFNLNDYNSLVNIMIEYRDKYNEQENKIICRS
ncbi:MAG TPA: tRNA dihydrouridine synthase DusB [Candidatus Eremiobacteraeota bacterium]|nr:MAG: tRNA-dihydrouridine synthase C [bacterium ADurb.Bin363]HPZ09118.1 tRNA dihydrouridine synthase DusB [Candidatus Eremiobacteraeota bacterium]